MKYKTFIFNLGYIEEAMMASLVVINYNGFESVEEGIKSFLDSIPLAIDTIPEYLGKKPSTEQYLCHLLTLKSHEFSQEEMWAFKDKGWDFYPSSFPDGKIAFVSCLDSLLNNETDYPQMKEILRDSITATIKND